METRIDEKGTNNDIKHFVHLKKLPPYSSVQC